MQHQEALVYSTTSSTRNEINDYLMSQHLYRYDDIHEEISDRNRPSAQRPILRKSMMYAAMSGAQVIAPRVFVTDHLSTLGPDRISQAAVVGALLTYGLRVHADYREIEGDWYYKQIRALGFLRIDPIMRSLMSLKAEDEGASGVVCTSLHRWYGEAVLRVHELVDQEELSFTQSAAVLTVEGYHNRKGRVRWYPKAAHLAYKAAR